MAAKERAVLLRSARRKILQNSICRQSGQTEIEFCKNFCRVLPLQGLAAKAGSPLQSRHQWERAGWDRRRCLLWRPDLQPLLQRHDTVVDAPLPIDLPAIALAALPARPPREDAPGCRCRRKRRRSPARIGTGMRCAAGLICRVSTRMEAFETGVIFRVGPWPSRPAAKTARRRSFCARRRRGRADWPAQEAGFLTGGGKPRGSSRQRSACSRPAAAAGTTPADQALHDPLARMRSSSVMRASTCCRTSRPAPRSISCQSGRLRSVSCMLRLVS